MLSELRPIDYALNQLSVNISLGILLGLPIAALFKRFLMCYIYNGQSEQENKNLIAKPKVLLQKNNE